MTASKMHAATEQAMLYALLQAILMDASTQDPAVQVGVAEMGQCVRVATIARPFTAPANLLCAPAES